jgi:uncharacterized protein (DUF885 family)
MDENKKLDKLSKKFFDTVIERSPVFATYLGLHKFDKLMPDESKKTYLEFITIYKKFLKEFEKIKADKLNFDGKINLELAIHNLKLFLFDIQEIRYWEQNPDIVSSIGDAIFPLFVRDFAPFEKRIDSIIARLEKSNKIIEQTKTRISKPVKLWTEIAIESCERIPSFFDEVLRTAKEKNISKNKLLRLEKAIKKANGAVEEYKEYLQNKILPKSAERFYIGEEKFRRLLGLRKLGMTPEEINKLGEKYLMECKKQLQEIANKIKAGATVEEARKIVDMNRPKTFNEILSAYRDSIIKAKKFVIENKIATMPKSEELLVIETPIYMRHFIPFAAYFQPAKFDKKQQGIYVVTPTEQGNFERYNYADIHNTSVHEGYPGHHLQLSCANTNPHIIRIFDHATEFVEGWAHYCEEYMKEQGYDKSLEGAFVQTEDMIWRAARIIIDVKLSTGKMSFDEAVEFLMKEAGKDKEGAVAEIKRYTSSPGYQLSYLLGKHMIKQLKQELKKKFGKRFSDKIFHDTLLYSGSLPIFFHRKVLEQRFKTF